MAQYMVRIMTLTNKAIYLYQHCQLYLFSSVYLDIDIRVDLHINVFHLDSNCN